MQDRPTAIELLETVAGFLEDELMPTLDGPASYRTRVAVNLLKILAREALLGPDAIARECELLSDLLRVGYVSDPQLLDPQLLNRRLATAIDAGEVSHEQVWPALMEIARAKVAVIRPGYDAYDASGELP
jgi:Domain of unknown function (DUF6285)